MHRSTSNIVVYCLLTMDGYCTPPARQILPLRRDKSKSPTTLVVFLTIICFCLTVYTILTSFHAFLAFDLTPSIIRGHTPQSTLLFPFIFAIASISTLIAALRISTLLQLHLYCTVPRMPTLIHQPDAAAKSEPDSFMILYLHIRVDLSTLCFYQGVTITYLS